MNSSHNVRSHTRAVSQSAPSPRLLTLERLSVPKPRLGPTQVGGGALGLSCCLHGPWETLITQRLMSPEMCWSDKPACLVGLLQKPTFLLICTGRRRCYYVNNTVITELRPFVRRCSGVRTKKEREKVPRWLRRPGSRRRGALRGSGIVCGDDENKQMCR